jgi:hypothetical protein
VTDRRHLVCLMNPYMHACMYVEPYVCTDDGPWLGLPLYVIVCCAGNWVRLHLPLPPLACSDLSTGIALNLTGMAVGEAWVNGHSLGRYSLRKLGPEKDCTVCNRTGPFDPNGECHTRCGDFAEPLYHAPRGWLEGPCSTAAEGSTATTTLQHVILWEATSGGADPSKVAFVVVTES